MSLSGGAFVKRMEEIERMEAQIREDDFNHRKSMADHDHKMAMMSLQFQLDCHNAYMDALVEAIRIESLPRITIEV